MRTSLEKAQLSLFPSGSAMPAADPARFDRLTCRELARAIASKIEALSTEVKIDVLNEVRTILHDVSPMKSEPVDCVLWEKESAVFANEYNPNTVAPPEMELLAHSILTDGYTQPIVTFPANGRREVVDGFHRSRVGKENDSVRSRLNGYLPVVSIKAEQSGINDRVAATIRHNRARGKHRVDAMSDIVVELKRRNWSDERIGKELGMDPDEVLRLMQITGLAEVFRDQDFSEAWEAGNDKGTGEEVLSDVIENYEPKANGRILHTWEKWECYRAGFYAERPPEGMTVEQGQEAYRGFLADLDAFENALRRVITEWKHSCEHYLTNDRMNRIAWLGQASVALAKGVPSCCRGGYNLLLEEQQSDADNLALLYLNEWLEGRGQEPASMKQALGRTEAELY